MVCRPLVFAGLLAAVVAVPAVAQSGAFTVGPRLGYVKYDDNTAMEEAALLGLDASYNITDNIGLGLMLDVSRPNTDGTAFPAEMSFSDTTLLFAVQQPLTVLQYGLRLEIGAGTGFRPFLTGGAGGYRITLDPQAAATTRHVTGLRWIVGGGVQFRTGGNTSVRLEVYDFLYSEFDRSELNTVREDFAPTRFPDVIPARDPFKGAVHNLHVALAFRFAPGGGR